MLEASALQGVENYDPSSWLPAEALYLQLRSQPPSDLHLQLNEDVSINSLKLLRFVQRQPSGLPGRLVAYFIQDFFFFFWVLLTHLIIKLSGEGGCLSQRKEERKEYLKADFPPLVRTELLKRGCLRPCLEYRLKERCGFSIERVLIIFSTGWINCPYNLRRTFHCRQKNRWQGPCLTL